MQLTAELARYQAYVDRNEREALLSDVDGLRSEVLRLQDTVERLSAAPQVTVNLMVPDTDRCARVWKLMLTGHMRVPLAVAATCHK